MKRELCILCLGVLLFSCQKTQEPLLSLDSPTTFSFPADGGTETISFSANREWTASSSDSWVSVSPSSGSGTATPIRITLSGEANTTYEDRLATVAILMEGQRKSVSVSQAANLGLVVPTQGIMMTSEAGVIELAIESNVQYVVSVSEGWVHEVGTRGLITSRLSFVVDENETYDERRAVIRIIPQDASVPEQIVSVV